MLLMLMGVYERRARTGYKALQRDRRPAVGLRFRPSGHWEYGRLSAGVLGRWVPDSPEDVAAVFAKADFPWWIAGGYAIELAVGRELRVHGDLDVLVLRRDQALAHELLADWDLHVADPPGQGELRPWRPGEVLRPPLHDIWCRRTSKAPWSVQLMLDEAEGTQWVSRRTPEIRLPIDQLGRTSEAGIPYLAPEVQLFYKAKATRDKDKIDFEAVLPLLDAPARAWRDVPERYGPWQGSKWGLRSPCLGRAPSRPTLMTVRVTRFLVRSTVRVVGFDSRGDPMGLRKRAVATVVTLIAAFLLPLAAQAPAQAAANAWTPGISPLHSGEWVKRDIQGGDAAEKALKDCARASGIACVSVGQGDGKQSIFHLFRCGTRSLSNFIDALTVINNQTGGAEVRFTGPNVGTYRAPAHPSTIWNFPNEATLDFNTMSIC